MAMWQCCNFNLKRAKVDEKGFQRYVQKMLKQELDINWSPGTVLVRREKKKKDKNNKDTQQYVQILQTHTEREREEERERVCENKLCLLLV